MSDERKKPWYLQLPAKLAAGVVFLVALTTLAGNLLELNEKRHALDTPAAAAPVQPKPAPVQPAIPRKMRIGVDRITVRQDGSPGTTDWRFVVEADGEALFAFRQDELDDTVDRNVAVPRDASAALRVAPGRALQLEIKGWRGSRFRLPGGEPDASGKGALPAGGSDIAPIRVHSGDGAAEFTFHLSADEG